LPLLQLLFQHGIATVAAAVAATAVPELSLRERERVKDLKKEVSASLFGTPWLRAMASLAALEILLHLSLTLLVGSYRLPLQ
jgi:hypothetical protein